jgi:hypothetical protein
VLSAPLVLETELARYRERYDEALARGVVRAQAPNNSGILAKASFAAMTSMAPSRKDLVPP